MMHSLTELAALGHYSRDNSLTNSKLWEWHTSLHATTAVVRGRCCLCNIPRVQKISSRCGTTKKPQCSFVLPNHLITAPNWILMWNCRQLEIAEQVSQVIKAGYSAPYGLFALTHLRAGSVPDPSAGLLIRDFRGQQYASWKKKQKKKNNAHLSTYGTLMKLLLSFII